MEIDPELAAEKLLLFIEGAMGDLKRDGLILGLSGGIDSAVIAALCARVAGPNKVLALLMPEKDSNKKHLADAKILADTLRLKTKFVDITPYLKQIGIYRMFPVDALVPGKYLEKMITGSYRYISRKAKSPYFLKTLLNAETGLYGNIMRRSFAYYRAKHRMRMLILYLFAEQENRLVVGAANKTEYQIGFFVKHGVDSATDIMPIMNLYKTQVIALAKFLSIPSYIIDKPPSPDILPGLEDEAAIGLDYKTLDLILLAMEKDWSDSEIETSLAEIGVTREDIFYVRRLMADSSHMRQVYVPD